MNDIPTPPQQIKRGYDHETIDKKWQQRWAKDHLFEVDAQAATNKFYSLDMFPYPSGAGLHVGHPRGYVATDVISRMKRAQGYDVLHPMGWDAFGLPAENYAIKTGVHPKETTTKAINQFRSQMQAIGLSYDWTREINTSDPSYYKWTQWLFLKLYEHGLAYQKEAPVNWCPKDQTVLANEQVVSGKCDRCGAEVEQRNLTQWFFRITQYAEELLSGLDDLDWPEPIKLMQRNWIGKSEGATITWKIDGSESLLETFTTRPDTLHGATYLVLAPEHPLIDLLKYQIKNGREVGTYQDAARKKTELERKSDTKTKTGVQLEGINAIHPITGERLPIWISDYVLMSYGTGSIMAVPAHDERDWEFANKHDLEIKWVIEAGSHDKPWTKAGTLINSGDWNGLHSEKDLSLVLVSIIKHAIGEQTTTYRLRDWLVSRQRYWGAPIPMLHCHGCGLIPVPVDELPVLLPDDIDFRPDGESPLLRSKEFQEVHCASCLDITSRDPDTMDTFVDSSWYFLRYLSPDDVNRPFDSELIKKWLPVDLYVGGAEHAILHLLYARFITMALADIMNLPIREPFKRLINVGLIRATDGRKMSKSLGNVVNPDDVIKKFGADTLRAYEMFMGPFSDSMPWSTESMVGVRRWLDRVWLLKEKVSDTAIDASELLDQLETTIVKVTSDIDEFKFNTVISSLMESTNALREAPAISKNTFARFLQILAPVTPHIAEEIWSELSLGDKSITTTAWPQPDPTHLKVINVTIAVQVDGKTRDTLETTQGAVESDLIKAARALPGIMRHLENEPSRTIVVPDKVVNFLT